MGQPRDSDGNIFITFGIMIFVALFPLLMFAAGYYEGQKVRVDVCSITKTPGP